MTLLHTDMPQTHSQSGGVSLLIYTDLPEADFFVLYLLFFNQSSFLEETIINIQIGP